MKFISTRNNDNAKTFSQALKSGLASDGGLYVPEHFPDIDLAKFTPQLNYPEFAAQLLQYFLEDDDLQSSLLDICTMAFDFAVPLSKVNNDTSLLELYHGPTLSCKDFGARFLAECMTRLIKDEPLTIMVATSGDTGSAVAAAFHKKPNIRVVVLYPKGQISFRQEQQITCWGDNVLAISVNGSFDDCQRLVKSAFANEWWQHNTTLSTANSINIGRLLPQIVYYAYASTQFFNTYQVKPGFIVPSGNLGNVTAAYWAMHLGFPMREIAIATNANHVVGDFIETGEFSPRPSIKTLANAMDVGKPSNFERLHYLYPDFEQFKHHVNVASVSDDQIRFAIKEAYTKQGLILCPHTATAYFMRQHLSQDPWIIVGTADPCKFETIIEPLLRVHVPVAPQLQDLLERPIQERNINATIDTLIDEYSSYFSIK